MVDRKSAAAPRYLYREAWRCAEETFLDWDKLSDWKDWKTRFDRRMKTIEDAVACTNKMLASLDDSYTYLLSTAEVKENRRVYRGVAKEADLPVVSARLNAGIGYLQITSFQGRDTCKLVENELTHTLRQARSLIIDLRDNLGGLTKQAIRCACLFIDWGRLVTMVERVPGTQEERTMEYSVTAAGIAVRTNSGRYRRTKTRPPLLVPTTVPIVILVDRHTASAAELFTGALQDNNRAFVIGTKTFGKGIGQSFYEMPFGTQLSVTDMRFYTPSGFWLGDGQKIRHGIRLDLPVRGKFRFRNLNIKHDDKLQAALNYLGSLR